MAVLAVEVSSVSCHGGAVREERREERRRKGEEGRIMCISLYQTIMLERREREEKGEDRRNNEIPYLSSILPHSEHLKQSLCHF